MIDLYNAMANISTEELIRFEMEDASSKRPRRIGSYVVASTYTDTEVDLIRHITCDISTWMTMNQALDILWLGYAEKYIKDPSFRTLVDLWAKTGFAGLTLQEFLNAEGNEIKGLSKV